MPQHKQFAHAPERIGSSVTAPRPVRQAELIKALLAHYGAQNWWPAESRIEVIVGAILVQNTNWSNAELAVRNLKAAKVLSLAGLRRAELGELEHLLRPSGFFRQKAGALKAFIAMLDE